MEHAMNEKMREMASKGELSEASYKKLVDELGRTKEEAGAPLFEVAFIVNTVSAYSFTDANTDEECIGQLQTSEKHTCVMRGVKGAGWKNSGHFLAGRLLLDDDGKLLYNLQTRASVQGWQGRPLVVHHLHHHRDQAVQRMSTASRSGMSVGNVGRECRSVCVRCNVP